MAKIVIEIDCGNDLCGQCEKYELSGDVYCQIFGKELQPMVYGSNNYNRLPECLVAEVKE